MHLNSHVSEIEAVSWVNSLFLEGFYKIFNVFFLKTTNVGAQNHSETAIAN